MRQTNLNRSLPLVLVVALLVTINAGCAGIPSAMMYWIYGNRIDASCTALQGKRVAVVCVAGPGAGPADESERLASMISLQLKKEVKDIEVIRQAEIADWRDQNNWDQIDFKSIGRGVKADMVLALELESFSIHDGSTLLKGRATVSTKVFDMKDGGDIVFRDGPREISFPVNGAQHVVDRNESNFKSMFIGRLAIELSRPFHSYDKMDIYAQDAASTN